MVYFIWFIMRKKVIQVMMYWEYIVLLYVKFAIELQFHFFLFQQKCSITLIDWVYFNYLYYYYQLVIHRDHLHKFLLILLKHTSLIHFHLNPLKVRIILINNKESINLYIKNHSFLLYTFTCSTCSTCKNLLFTIFKYENNQFFIVVIYV